MFYLVTGCLALLKISAEALPIIAGGLLIVGLNNKRQKVKERRQRRQQAQRAIQQARAAI